MKRKPDPSPRGRRRLSEADFQAVGAFRLALRKFAAFSDTSAEAAGLTSQQHQALLAIRAHRGLEPMTIGELAECLLIRNHSAGELVGRLVGLGLVTKQESEIDRRRVVLRLTDDALERLEVITGNNLRELTSTAPIFRELLRTLRRIGPEKGSAPASRTDLTSKNRVRG